MKEFVTLFPADVYDQAKRIATGDMEPLVEFLHDLAQIPKDTDGPARNQALLNASSVADVYVYALVWSLREKGRGQPREIFTVMDAMRAVAAAAEYKRLEGTSAPAPLERRIMERFGVSRLVLRAAVNGEIPEGGVPGLTPVAK